MEELTITLSDENADFVNQVVSAGEFASASAFISELVQDKRKADLQTRLNLDRFLKEGMATEIIEVKSKTGSSEQPQFLLLRRPIEELLEEGLASEAVPVTEEFWEDMHRRFEERNGDPNTGH